MSSTCQHCGATNRPTNAFCLQCGLPLKAQRKGASGDRIIVMTLIGIVALSVIAAVLFISLGGGRSHSGNKPVAAAPLSSPSPQPSPPPGLTPAEHLAKAKELTAHKAASYPAAREHLSSIPPDANEYREAMKLWVEIDKREETEKKRAEAEAEKGRAEVRAKYADEAERLFLDQGLDFHVTVSGRSNTTISFKYVLMSRPIVYKMQNDTNLMQRLREMGFKKLIMTDGFYETWTFDL